MSENEKEKVVATRLCRCVQNCTVDIGGRRVYAEVGFKHQFEKCPDNFIEVSRKEQQALLSAVETEAAVIADKLIASIADEVTKGTELLAQLKTANQTMANNLKNLNK